MDQWYIGANESSLQEWYASSIGHRYTWNGKPFPTAPGNVRTPANGKPPVVGEPGGTPEIENMVPIRLPHDEQKKETRTLKPKRENKGKNESVVTKLSKGVHAVANGASNAVHAVERALASVPSHTKTAAGVMAGVAGAASIMLNPASA